MHTRSIAQCAFAAALAVAPFAACAVTGNNMIPVPTDGPTARVRVVTHSEYGTNVNIRGYPGRNCSEGMEGGGNILNLAGITAFLKSRSGQTLGMPQSDKAGSAYKATELLVAGDQPFALSLQAIWLDEYFHRLQSCARIVTFVPKTGEDYEVFFDETMSLDCNVLGSQLISTSPTAPKASHTEPLELAAGDACTNQPQKKPRLPSPYDQPEAVPVPK